MSDIAKRIVARVFTAYPDSVDAWKIVDEEIGALQNENDKLRKRLSKLNDERAVTVCSACKRASCWQGQFYCDKAKGAGVQQMTVSALRALDLESEDFWK